MELYFYRDAEHGVVGLVHACTEEEARIAALATPDCHQISQIRLATRNDIDEVLEGSRRAALRTLADRCTTAT